VSVISNVSRTFFNGYNVATTGWIYNSSDGNNATTGWISAKADNVVVQVCVASLYTKAMLYRIEGRQTNGLSRPASIYVTSVAAAHGVDVLHEVSEKIDQIRVGARLAVVTASITGSPCNFYAAAILTEIK